MTFDTRPSHFSACNIEKLGLVCEASSYLYIDVFVELIFSSLHCPYLHIPGCHLLPFALVTDPWTHNYRACIFHKIIKQRYTKHRNACRGCHEFGIFRFSRVFLEYTDRLITTCTSNHIQHKIKMYSLPPYQRYNVNRRARFEASKCSHTHLLWSYQYFDVHYVII